MDKIFQSACAYHWDNICLALTLLKMALMLLSPSQTNMLLAPSPSKKIVMLLFSDGHESYSERSSSQHNRMPALY